MTWSAPNPGASRASGSGTRDHTLELPRILCLHGGGTNSRIFRAQCRILRRHLEHSFRLVFADAPYLTKPGPDVTSVYAEWGPFRSWLKPQPGSINPFVTPAAHHLHDTVMPVHETDAAEVISAIDRALAAAVQADDALGATGEWVGLLGFSQGAKMAASLLLREQERMMMAPVGALMDSKSGGGAAGVAGAAAGRRRQQYQHQHQHQHQHQQHGYHTLFRFAVLMAGRGPLVSLDPEFHAAGGGLRQQQQEEEEDVNDKWSEAPLWLPTVHVHGLQDEGLALHRQLWTRCCVRESTTLVEWHGNHRVPIKAESVKPVVSALMRAYWQSNVY